MRKRRMSPTEINPKPDSDYRSTNNSARPVDKKYPVLSSNTAIDEENHSAVEFIFKAEGKLDILVHDAALACMDALRNASSVDTDIIKETMEINFYGVIYITQAFLPLLREPVILLISTDMASNTQQSPPNSYLHVVVYSTSKAVANSSSHSRKS
ncbi:short-chain dehydrogenase reductase sdr [Moniliophthora roreri MCA 2997]|uniref:Short-chain dehydrogenase reductase sdr n=1 Tax=Moniliophthora roreri (strain MCA 2997) TaxID=1381753 RepID=V2WZV3_MONRO|nr:short-chain dehydrogenase reductase sdr [Moniliophthora roreri MCA 2997]